MPPDSRGGRPPHAGGKRFVQGGGGHVARKRFGQHFLSDTGVIDEIVSPYGIVANVDYRRGVPPVINDPESTRILGRAIEHTLGPDGRVATTQSLGGEDFGWFLDRVPGAMARLCCAITPRVTTL